MQQDFAIKILYCHKKSSFYDNIFIADKLREGGEFIAKLNSSVNEGEKEGKELAAEINSPINGPKKICGEIKIADKRYIIFFGEMICR